MPALNFKQQFVPRIEIGLRNPNDPFAKTHTIRAPRKDGRDPKPGDTLHLYTGLRQKGARRIAVVECTRVESIVIRETKIAGEVIRQTRNKTIFAWHRRHDIFVGPKTADASQGTRANAIAYPERYSLALLTSDEAAALAVRDGFTDFAEMMAFWRGRLPFFGYIIHWRCIEVRVSGGEEPMTEQTRRALQNVAEAAYAHVSKRMRRRKA